MKQQSTKLLTYALMGAFFGLLIGCASTDKIDALSQQLQTVEATANEANTKAEQAQSDAAEALTAVEESKTMAEESQACCQANTEKMNRMFDTIQQK